MTEATMHLVFKPVGDFGNIYDLLQKDPKLAPQHAFILHTRSDGNTYVYRGGSSASGKDTVFDIMIGDLHFIKAPYKDKINSPDFNEKWKTEYPNILLDKGNDNKLDPKAEELVTFGDWIHEQKLDYKLPIGSERQNSNMLAKMAVESIGYKFVLPKFTAKDGKEYEAYAPGYDQKQLSVTLVDKFVLDIINNPEKHTAALYGMYADPAALYNQLEEAKQLSLKARKLETPETKVEVTRKIIEELLSFKNPAGGSCTVDVETGGSCTAETSFTTNDYTTQSTFTSQPPAYHSLFKTLDKKGIILDGDLSPNKKVSAKTHVVEKGDTVWSIAKSYGISINELISIEGNQFLQNSRYVDNKGRDNIKILQGQSIKLPKESEYKSYNLFEQDSTFSFSGSTHGNFKYINVFGSSFGVSPYSILKFHEMFKEWSRSYKNTFNNNGYDDTYEKFKEYEGRYNSYKSKESAEEYLKRNGHTGYQRVFDEHKEYHKEYFHRKQYSEGRKIYSGTGWDAGVKAKSEHGGTTYSISFGIKFPVVLDLEGKGLDLIGLENSHTFFDMNSNGYVENTGWIKNGMGLLCYDFDNNGIINQTKEISFMLWDSSAKTDLEGLKVFDKNKDGKLDASDADFSKFLVWQDYNMNGVSESNELKSLKDLGINTIYLNNIKKYSEDKEGNLVVGSTTMDRNGVMLNNVYDVGFKHSDVGMRYEDDYSDVTLHYSDNKKVHIYRIEDEGGEAINLKGMDYDVAIGNIGNDIITGNDKGVVIDGGRGNDEIIGGSGNEWLKGGEGSDIIKGGAGNDILLIDGEDKPENIDGGTGYDIAIVSTNQGVTLDIAKANIEAFYGNKGSDNITARNARAGVYIDGGEGDDIIEGSNYDDILIGGKGNDKIICGAGNDIIFIDDEDDLDKIDCKNGEKTLHITGTKKVEIDTSKINAKYIYGGSENNNIKIKGNLNVVLKGGIGNDILQGGEGVNIFDPGVGSNTLIAGNNGNIFIVGEGINTIVYAKESIGDNEVIINGNIRKEQLILRKEGKDLIIKTSKDIITRVKDYYEKKIELSLKLNHESLTITPKLFRYTTDAFLSDGIDHNLCNIMGAKSEDDDGGKATDFEIRFAQSRIDYFTKTLENGKNDKLKILIEEIKAIDSLNDLKPISLVRAIKDGNNSVDIAAKVLLGESTVSYINQLSDEAGEKVFVMFAKTFFKDFAFINTILKNIPHAGIGIMAGNHCSSTFNSPAYPITDDNIKVLNGYAKIVTTACGIGPFITTNLPEKNSHSHHIGNCLNQANKIAYTLLTADQVCGAGVNSNLEACYEKITHKIAELYNNGNLHELLIDLSGKYPYDAVFSELPSIIE